MPVKQALEALIVNGEGSREQARYLFNALDPYRDGSEPLPVHVEEMSDGRLLETDLHRFDCVLLSNVGQFTPAEARILANYAAGGGGLIFFLGNRVDAGNYNQELGGGRPVRRTCFPRNWQVRPTQDNTASIRAATTTRSFASFRETRTPGC